MQPLLLGAVGVDMLLLPQIMMLTKCLSKVLCDVARLVIGKRVLLAAALENLKITSP